MGAAENCVDARCYSAIGRVGGVARRQSWFLLKNWSHTRNYDVSAAIIIDCGSGCWTSYAGEKSSSCFSN